MKLSDLRQGRTLYLVMVFPECDDRFSENNSSIEKIVVAGHAYQDRKCSSNYGLWMFDYINQYGRIVHGYARTWRIGSDNGYNFHRAFTTRKQADRYYQRMLARCLTAAEAELFNKLVVRRKLMDEANILTPMDFDIEPEPEREGYTLSGNPFRMTQLSVLHTPNIIRISGV